MFYVYASRMLFMSMACLATRRIEGSLEYPRDVRGVAVIVFFQCAEMVVLQLGLFVCYGSYRTGGLQRLKTSIGIKKAFLVVEYFL